MSIRFTATMVAIAFLCVYTTVDAVESNSVKLIETGDTIRVEMGGELFTEYFFKDVPRPYFYPVIGPTGKSIIRNWPMKEVEHEEKDHTHHRSLWYTHGAVNGYDFWTDRKEGMGTIIHQEFSRVHSYDKVATIESKNNWIAPDGTVVCTDKRVHRFYSYPSYKMIDFEITYLASNGKLVLGDTKEGSMAMRLAPTMRVKGDVAKGTIVNSEGIRNKKTWGKRAKWCDYYGPVDGEVVGVAIFDHPDNPKHPTWWHVRDYGLFAANPFGVHDFEKKPEGTGNIEIPAGKSLKFRYRLYFHKGDEKAAEVEKHYLEYIKQPSN